MTPHDSLLFDLQRSVRYHDRRVAHFDLLHKLTNVLTILLAGIVLLEVFGTDSPWWAKVLAGLAAVLGAFDLVVGFSARANQHRDFKRKFCSLERRLIESSSEQLALISCERLEIEAEEPPILRALDIICHNELLMAKGYSPKGDSEQYAKLPWYMRLTANWCRWPDAPLRVKSE